MSETLYHTQRCTLTCQFERHSGWTHQKPSQEQMLDWLENKSGLSEEYFDKIAYIEYNSGLNITFDETANCFKAIQQMRNRVFYGRHESCIVQLKCPKGEFKPIRISPDIITLLTVNDVIQTLKEYGEIIEMSNVKWRDNVCGDYMLTGDIDVRLLMKKLIPATLIIGGVNCVVKSFVYETNYSDVLLDTLWNNCNTPKETMYPERLFSLCTDKKPDCKIIIKHYAGVDYTPSQRDVYEWLVRKSGLGIDYLRRIVVFKYVRDGHYEILFEEGVNCLLAIKHIKDRMIQHCQNIETQADISCPKGLYKDVILKSYGGKLLKRESVEKALGSYGVIKKFKKTNAPPTEKKFKFGDGKILVSFEVHCKMFLKSEVPDNIQINESDVQVITSEAEPEDHDGHSLIKFWSGLKTID